MATLTLYSLSHLFSDLSQHNAVPIELVNRSAALDLIERVGKVQRGWSRHG
jgi:hypothetical protein